MGALGRVYAGHRGVPRPFLSSARDVSHSIKRMRQRIFSIVLTLTLAVIVGCSFITRPSSAPSASTQVTTAQPSAKSSPSPTVTGFSSSPQPAPQVDADRLFAHVLTLNFERFTKSERELTREYIMQVLREAGWKPQLQPFETGVNLVAQRPGTNPSAGSILVTAHYDTVSGSPGADDNASSVAAALEIARLLGPRSTPRTLQLAFFDQEETGLRGSLAYTANSTNLTNLHAVVNLEMLGYACYEPGCQTLPEGLPIKPPSDRGDFLGVAVDQEHASLLTAFQRTNASTQPPLLTLPVPFKGLFTPDLLRSDHAPFWAKNIGAVVVADTANFRNPHYHQPSDTPETLDRQFFTGATQIVLNAISTLLNHLES